MKHLTRQGGALFAVTALALGGLALPTSGAENDVTAPQSDIKSHTVDEDRIAANQQTLQGEVVNLQQFLLADTSNLATDRPGGEAAALPGTVSKDAPLGLCVKREGMIDALTTEHTYLILFDPGDKAQADAYNETRDLIGKQVTLTGKVVERASISGVVINSVQQDATGQASAQTEHR